ncbi:MAG: hypothetical protein HY663_05495 [Chloroflexi bacterium]|nr:hypothetical protein [Chloroflexota bacterium]
MAIETKTTVKSWRELTPEEKLQKRLDAWFSPPGVNFTTSEAEAAYKERVTHMIDALTLRKTPARVPVVPGLGAFAEAYCGYTHKDVMYDVDKSIDVMNRCTLEFQIDTKVGANAHTGRLWELVERTDYTWPGHGLADDADGIQYIEHENMKEDEYDALIKDPTAFWNRVYLPRVKPVMEPLSKLPYPLCGTGATAAIPSTLSAFGLPEVEAALLKMIAAGKETLAWQKKMGAANRRLTELGFPGIDGGASSNPLDMIGDSMRCTRGIVKDMFKQPEKLLEAMEVILPICIQRGIESTRLGSCPTVTVGTHKGPDGYMSDEHFKKFYWAPYRRICLALIEEGLIPSLAGQGSWNTRLEIIASDLPKGKFLFNYAQSDMTLTKEILGGIACLRGGVPAALLHAGTPQEVAEYCRKLIETVGKGGGYMFSTSQGVTRTTKAENVWAMINAAKKYGKY